MRALLVDDEPAALRRLEKLLADDGRLEITAKANNAAEAHAAIAKFHPDLIFLDIEMPGMSGIELAKCLRNDGEELQIVFVTAHEQFAVTAFRVAAIDYLLKPVDPVVLERTVDRLLRCPVGAEPVGKETIWVPVAGRLSAVAPNTIVRVEAERDYVWLHTEFRAHLMSATMKQIVTLLASIGCVRVHRSHAVCLPYVSSLQHVGHGAWQINLANGDSVPVGRSFLKSVKHRLGA